MDNVSYFDLKILAFSDNIGHVFSLGDISPIFQTNVLVIKNDF